MNEHEALKRAIDAANLSPCAKSKRGVVIWMPGTRDLTGSALWFSGFNAMPDDDCNGSDDCRAVCAKRCVHAEQAALLTAGTCAHGAEMLHVKVVNGQAVTSKEPSCWQCSRLILAAGIAGMWLLVEGDDGPELRRWTALEFHQATLEACGLVRPSRADDELLHGGCL